MSFSFNKRLTAYSLQLTAILLFFSVNLAQAAPVGSPPGLLKKGQWDFAIESGYTWERSLETDGKANYHVNIFHGYHARSYGLTDRLMVTGKAGGTSGYLYDETTSAAEGKTSLSGGFALGIQLQGIIYQHPGTGLQCNGGAQFLYLRSHHKKSGKANSDWYEWQANFSLAKEVGRFKPYAGIKYSTVDLDYDDGKGKTLSYDEDESLGPFIGTDIYFGQDKDLVINLEADFILNEYYGGIKYRF